MFGQYYLPTGLGISCVYDDVHSTIKYCSVLFRMKNFSHCVLCLIRDLIDFDNCFASARYLL